MIYIIAGLGAFAGLFLVSLSLVVIGLGSAARKVGENEYIDDED